MAKKFYDNQAEVVMASLYNNLSEKDRRRYAAVEATKLPHGGFSYIAKLFGCSRNVIYDGLVDLEDPNRIPKDRIRKAGGGRNKENRGYGGVERSFFEGSYRSYSR